MTDAIKEILLHVDAGYLRALVPKKRGIGFLRVPVGHHSQAWISEFEWTVGTDIVGLDGMVEVDCRRRNIAEMEPLFRAALTKAFGFPVRTVGRGEFWDNVPRTGDAPDRRGQEG